MAETLFEGRHTANSCATHKHLEKLLRARLTGSKGLSVTKSVFSWRDGDLELAGWKVRPAGFGDFAGAWGCDNDDLIIDVDKSNGTSRAFTVKALTPAGVNRAKEFLKSIGWKEPAQMQEIGSGRDLVTVLSSIDPEAVGKVLERVVDRLAMRVKEVFQQYQHYQPQQPPPITPKAASSTVLNDSLKDEVIEAQADSIKARDNMLKAKDEVVIIMQQMAQSKEEIAQLKEKMARLNEEVAHSNNDRDGFKNEVERLNIELNKKQSQSGGRRKDDKVETSA